MISMKEMQTFLEENWPDYKWYVGTPFDWDSIDIICCSPKNAPTFRFPIGGVSIDELKDDKDLKLVLSVIARGLISQIIQHMESIK